MWIFFNQFSCRFSLKLRFLLLFSCRFFMYSLYVIKVKCAVCSNFWFRGSWELIFEPVQLRRDHFSQFWPFSKKVQIFREIWGWNLFHIIKFGGVPFFWKSEIFFSVGKKYCSKKSVGPKNPKNGQYGIRRVPRYKKNAPTPNIHEVRAIWSGATAPKTQNGDLKVTAGGKIWSKTDTTLWTP